MLTLSRLFIRFVALALIFFIALSFCCIEHVAHAHTDHLAHHREPALEMVHTEGYAQGCVDQMMVRGEKPDGAEGLDVITEGSSPSYFVCIIGVDLEEFLYVGIYNQRIKIPDKTLAILRTIRILC